VTVLHFNEDAHRYTVDGVEIPSVTQVLALAGLTDWSHCSEWARERGSVVHRAIHIELTSGLDWSTLPEPLHPYVSAELQAIEDLGAEIIASELRVYSRTYGYAGTLDRLVRLPRAGKSVIAEWDTKTGQVIDAYGLQTAAYAEALHEMAETDPEIAALLGGERVRERYALRLNPDGTYKLEPFTDRNDIVNFRAAVRVAHWKRERGIAA
jgi:hypothetical protein